MKFKVLWIVFTLLITLSTSIIAQVDDEEYYDEDYDYDEDEEEGGRAGAGTGSGGGENDTDYSYSYSYQVRRFKNLTL